jgi:uncharacterized protein (DUF1501 family)
LYDTCSGPVYRLALRLCRSSHEAEDLAHDVFLRYWQQGRYDPARGPVLAYLLLLTRSMAINRLNQVRAGEVSDTEVATRIAQYEMAFRMQASVPGLMDVSGESAQTLALYGCQPGDGSFASNCLLARRLAERGSRFIQLYHRDWDHHSLLKEELPLRAKEVDRACMALITDLKQRGMFEDTLIVWSGEFGRTPMKQGDKGPVGRDHHNKAMSMWLAGAGVKGGLTHGATDELGYAAVDKVCTVHDLHATMLHQLGVQPEAFTFKFQGLDAKLTGVEPSKVIKEIIA